MFRTARAAFVPHPPTRPLDTRTTGNLAPFAATRLKVVGSGGVPVVVTAVVEANLHRTADHGVTPRLLDTGSGGGAA